MVDLRDGRLGSRTRLRARLAQLLAVRGAARTGGGAHGSAGAAAAGVAAVEGALPARQSAQLQPQVLPALGAPLHRLRAAPRPAARLAGSAGRGDVSTLPAVKLGFALALALASAITLNWGYVAQHGAASTLPPLSLRRPFASLRALFTQRRWLAGFVAGLGGWVLYVAALALAPLSLVQATSAGGIGVLALLVPERLTCWLFLSQACFYAPARIPPPAQRRG